MNSMLQEAEAPKYLRGMMFNQNNNVLKERQILVLKTGIAGSRYHIENEEERDTLNNLQPGTELKLFREPDNKYDEWAIMVYLGDDLLGYITRFKNEPIARLMDAGKKFTAIVDEPEADEPEDAGPDGGAQGNGDADKSDNANAGLGDKNTPGDGQDGSDSRKLRKARYRTTEDLSLPFSVYMIEEE